jgi:hypothetical protein
MGSMRIFYTGMDIEDLAASGVRQLAVGPGVALTDAARERAGELGIALVTPGNGPSNNATAPAAPAKVEAQPLRPRGCQHGPLPARGIQKESVAGGGAMVDQLVEAVSALKKRGG